MFYLSINVYLFPVLPILFAATVHCLLNYETPLPARSRLIPSPGCYAWIGSCAIVFLKLYSPNLTPVHDTSLSHIREFMHFFANNNKELSMPISTAWNKKAKLYPTRSPIKVEKIIRIGMRLPFRAHVHQQQQQQHHRRDMRRGFRELFESTANRSNTNGCIYLYRER